MKRKKTKALKGSSNRKGGHKMIIFLLIFFIVCSFLSLWYLKKSITNISFNVVSKGGNVTGVGGLVGVNLGGTIKDCHSTAKIHVKGGDVVSNINISSKSSLNITFSIICSIFSISATLGILVNWIFLNIDLSKF